LSTKVEVTLQFTPTRTASQQLRQRVDEAFAAAGLTISSWTVPYGEDTELPGHLKWADPSLSITIEAEEGVAAARKFADSLGEALAAIRSAEPHLPFGIRVDSDGQRLWLSFRVGDPPDSIRQATTALHSTHFEDHQVWGWDSNQRIWIPI
jgi:hypothetical protein